MKSLEPLQNLLSAARNGDAEAQFQLAQHYYDQQEEYAALIWSFVATENGHHEATKLSETIQTEGMLPDEDLSLVFLELGCWYYLGKNVVPNPKLSTKYLDIAKQLGVPESFELEELRDRLDLPFLLDWNELFAKRED